MKRLWAFASLLMAGCGSPYVDSAFIPYYDSFQARYNESPYNIGAKFGDVKDGKVGNCYNGEIKIKKRVWDKVSDSVREAIVFHELGHCLLNLPHNTEKVRYKGELIPASIMSPERFEYSDYYDELRHKYLEALPVNKGIKLE